VDSVVLVRKLDCGLCVRVCLFGEGPKCRSPDVR
jgi:hypothetical protein